MQELSSVDDFLHDELLLTDEANDEYFMSLESALCGRYVIIFQGKIYLDATGMMPIFIQIPPFLTVYIFYASIPEFLCVFPILGMPLGWTILRDR